MWRQSWPAFRASFFYLGHLGCLAYLRTRANFRPVKTARPGRPWPRYWRDVPYPVPTVSAPPVARLTPRSWFNCVSPSAHQADLCHKPLSPRRGSSGVRLRVGFCLFRMRGQAIEAMKMRTGPALVPRAAPAFLLIGHAGRLLSMRQRQGRARLLLWHMTELGWRCWPRSPSRLSPFSFSSCSTGRPDYPTARYSLTTGPEFPAFPLQGDPRSSTKSRLTQRRPFLCRSPGSTSFHLRYRADQFHKGLAPGLDQRTPALPRSLTRFNCVSPALTS